MKTLASIYFLAVAFFSLLALGAYGFDKWRAQRGGRRIPEKTLHAIEFLGGWPGALIAQQLFRHKSRKAGFLLVFWLVTILHLVIVAGFTYTAFTIWAN